MITQVRTSLSVGDGACVLSGAEAAAKKWRGLINIHES